MHLMNSGLEKLIKNLPKKENINNLCPDFYGKQLQLLRKKGIYPYELEFSSTDWKYLMKQTYLKEKAFVVF